MNKNIVLCLDGTAKKLEPYATNVGRIYALLGNTENTVTFYEQGVSSILGQMFGYGIHADIEAGLRFVQQHYVPGDHIYLFGYSRGAFAARKIAQKLAEQDKAPYFIGVFDTVSSLGAIYRLTFNNHKLHPSIKWACHAVAIDEYRKHFTPHLWEDRPGIWQVWFPGMHSDIGGGEKEDGLSNVTLHWMIRSIMNLPTDRPLFTELPHEWAPNINAPFDKHGKGWKVLGWVDFRYWFKSGKRKVGPNIHYLTLQREGYHIENKEEMKFVGPFVPSSVSSS